MTALYGLGRTTRAVSKSQLSEILETQLTPNTPVKVTVVTDATYAKKNPLGQILKMSQVTGEINIDYRTQALKIDPDYDNKERKASYGEHKTPALIVHGEKTYLQVQLVTCTKKEDHLDPVYFVNSPDKGLYLSYKKEVSDYIAPVREKSEQEKQIPIRRFSFDSIVALEIDGNNYQISDLDKDRQTIINLVAQNHL